MKFSEVAQLLEKLEQTSSRNTLTEELAAFLKKTSSHEASILVYLLQGRLVPKYVDLEFNISKKLIIQALDDEFSKEEKTAKNLFNSLGDMGLVSEQMTQSQTTDKHLIDVYEELQVIAKLEGKGSQDGKKEKYISLVSSLTPMGVRYVTRMIIGNLRLGMSDKTILDALSWYAVGDKSLRKKLDRAYGVRADIGALTQVVLESKDLEKDLQSISLTPLTPVAAKLVERAKDYEEVWKRMPNCFVQPKLDGLRGQIHFDGKTHAEIYSRNMESLTKQFPEITRDIQKFGKSIILDSEIIGWNQKENQYLQFQDTIKRRRKYDITQHAQDIPIRAMCFDVLFFDGKDLTEEPLEKRLELLSNLMIEHKTESLHMLETKQMKSSEELKEYFEEKVYAGLEGIITKQLQTTYEAGTRNFSWIKLKANTMSDLVDTLDVAVLGYYSGKGTRSKFGVGTLLAGIFDPKTESYYSIGKVGSGFTDENLGIIKKDLDEIAISQKPNNYFVDSTLEPDVWVQPKIIMEIVADELTRSKIHLAAKGIKTKVKNDEYEKGISVRFPRMKIWNRKDKDIPTTVEELVRMYEIRRKA